MLAVPVVISHVGGVQALGEYVGSIEPRVTGWWFGWRELVAFGIAFGLSIAAAPYEMTRYYSMRDVATVRYAIGISMVIQVLIGGSVMILGIGMRGLFPYLPSADQASSIMASTVMSPVLGALFLIMMLWAIISTVNSILLVTGGAFAHDLYKRLMDPKATRAAPDGESRLDRGARPRAVLVCAAAVRRRADDRHRAGEVHRQLLLRACRPRPELAPRHEGGRDLEHGGRVCRLPAVDVTFQRSFASHGIDSVEVGVVLSAVVFIVVSRLTRPTPAENLRIFFDDAPESRVEELTTPRV